VSLRLRAAAATDVGNIRENNQDDLLIVEDSLFVVADGMGGHVAGEVASREAVEAMEAAFATPASSDDLREAVRTANGAVWKRGADNPSYRGMGTTVTAVGVIDGDQLAVANVGDSRTYLLRDDELHQLTQDHSFVQEAVRSGQLTRAQAESHPRRSQLTRALGVGDDVDVDVEVLEPLSGDRLLLCSDGLWDEVGDELIAMVLSGRDEPEDAASELVRWAKEAGGRDNITVIVVDVLDGGEAGRAKAASAALDGSGDRQTATSRPGVATAILPAEDGQAPAKPSTDRWNRPADGSLMKASAPAAATPVAPPRSRLVTWRVVVFVVALVAVLATAAVIVSRGGAAWAVTLDGNTIVVMEGDRIREAKPLQVNQMPPDIQTALRRGVRVKDRAAADAYVDGITRRALAEGTLQPVGAGTVLPATSSTTPFTTTPVPSVPPPSTAPTVPTTPATPLPGP
jgi:serine/threonine protein phosphatase PrpC